MTRITWADAAFSYQLSAFSIRTVCDDAKRAGRYAGADSALFGHDVIRATKLMAEGWKLMAVSVIYVASFVTPITAAGPSKSVTS